MRILIMAAMVLLVGCGNVKTPGDAIDDLNVTLHRLINKQWTEAVKLFGNNVLKRNSISNNLELEYERFILLVTEQGYIYNFNLIKQQQP